MKLSSVLKIVEDITLMKYKQYGWVQEKANAKEKIYIYIHTNITHTHMILVLVTFTETSPQPPYSTISTIYLVSNQITWLISYPKHTNISWLDTSSKIEAYILWGMGSKLWAGIIE